MTAERAVAGSSRTAAQLRASPSRCPLKETNDSPSCFGGCNRGEDQRRRSVHACAPGTSQQRRRPSACRAEGRGFGHPREGEAPGGAESSPWHLQGGYREGRARLLMVVRTGETLGINGTERDSDWVLNSSLNYPVILYFPCALASHVRNAKTHIDSISCRQQFDENTCTKTVRHQRPQRLKNKYLFKTMKNKYPSHEQVQN